MTAQTTAGTASDGYLPQFENDDETAGRARDGGVVVTAVPPPTDLAAWLDGLEAAHAAATSGPWETTCWGGHDWSEYGVVWGEGSPVVVGETDQDQANAALIVAAVNALPRLVAAVRAAYALADRWEQFAAERLTGLDARHMRAAAADVRRYVTDALIAERTTP